MTQLNKRDAVVSREAAGAGAKRATAILSRPPKTEAEARRQVATITQRDRKLLERLAEL